MLMDKYYEFYCIIERSSEQETITSKKLIQISSQIIRWCKKNHARLLLLYNKYHTGTYTHRHIHTQTHTYIHIGKFIELFKNTFSACLNASVNLST